MGEGAGGTRIRWKTVASPRGMAMLATVNKWEKLGARYGGWPAHFLSGELSAPLAGIQKKGGRSPPLALPLQSASDYGGVMRRSLPFIVKTIPRNSQQQE